MTLRICTLIIAIGGIYLSGYGQKDKTNHFDFWIGEWNVYKYGTDTLVGKSQITSILSGTAIQEHYQSTRGPFEGTSLNMYNKANDQWEQFWVDNSGLRLHIKGGIQGGSMVLESDSLAFPVNKISWTPQENGEVRQTWEQKQKMADPWKIVFDGIYRSNN
ncbi:MAG: hypothetical protein AAGA10_13875 [Bacteroidota bacterium]